MARIRYTHDYDLFWKVFRMFGGLACGGAAGLLMVLLRLPDIVQVVAGMGAGLPMLGWLLDKPIPTYLYVRRSLKTPISLKDARLLDSLFVSLDAKTWDTHKDVLRLPIQLRRPYLLKQSVQLHRRLTPEEFLSTLQE